jgi:ribosomal protein S18 acetylase RimI-like enzyme
VLVTLDTPEPIERFAKRDLPLHIYEIGDLDPFFWPRTRFWGWTDREGGDPSAIALVHDGGDPPTLLALGRDDAGATAELLVALRERLPPRIYAHLSPGLIQHLGPSWRPQPHIRHDKMLLVESEAIDAVDCEGVERLSADDLPQLRELYARAYPGNWFDPRMLETREYHGIRESERLVAVAGVHVFSPRYSVAALGNVTTDPAHRRRGLARRTTAALCRSLHRTVGTIGLNVRADNEAVIHCYRGLGFVRVAEYDELMLEPALQPA